MKTYWTMAIACAILVSTGCTAVKDSMRISEKDSKWNPISALSAKRDKDDEDMPAQTMAAIWKDSVYEEPGKPRMRGFGGRIFFYDAENNAVKADGELVVYGFEDGSKDSSKPDKKFVFKKDQFQQHFSKSPLGGSYSVWIPWDELGGYRKSVTLIPIFKTDDERIIKTGQSINLLPGKEPEANPEHNEPYRFLGSSSAVIGQSAPKRTQPEDGVAQASYSSDAEGTGGVAEDRSRLRVSEISLTRNLQKLINRGGASGSQTNENVDASDTEDIEYGRIEVGKRKRIVPGIPMEEAEALAEAEANGEEPAKVSSRVYGAPGPIKR